MHNAVRGCVIFPIHAPGHNVLRPKQSLVTRARALLPVTLFRSLLHPPVWAEEHSQALQIGLITLRKDLQHFRNWLIHLDLRNST